MTRFLIRATVVATALTLCYSTTEVRAQTAARPSGTSVAVIDLQDVLEAHAGLKAQMEQLKTQKESLEAYFRQERQKAEALAEQLKTIKPGTPDYAAKEKEFASKQADLQVQARQKSRELFEQEAQIHYDVYQEVQQHVARFCQSYGIQLVIRFSRQPIDASKPDEVRVGLMREVVYQNSLDITQHIIDSLNKAGAAPAQPNVSVGQRPPAIPRGTQR